MSSGTTDAPRRTARPQRWAMWGFVVGVAVTVPFTVLALLTRVGEAALPFVVPSTTLLTPLSGAMASWPGIVNVTIASLVNGVVYSAVALAVAVAAHRRP